MNDEAASKSLATDVVIIDSVKLALAFVLLVFTLVAFTRSSSRSRLDWAKVSLSFVVFALTITTLTLGIMLM